MLIVDSLIVSGVKFVLTRLAEAVEAEMYDETHLREELLAAQMKLELGEIDEAEFAAIEEGVLAGLREIGERKRGLAAGGGAAKTKTTKKTKASAAAAEAHEPARDGARRYTVESVEASFGHEEEPER